MRVCLQCNSEYIDDPLVCRSCGAETVTEEEAALQLQLRDRMAKEKLVSVYRFESPVDEAILARLMKDAGIPWAVRGGSSGALPGVDHGLTGWGELLVPEDSVEQARRVVAHYERSIVVDHDGDDAAAAEGGVETGTDLG